MVGIFGALVFLALIGVYAIRISQTIKVVIFTTFILLFVLGFNIFGDKNAIKSIFDWKAIAEAHATYQQYIETQRESYKRQPIPYKIYHKNAVYVSHRNNKSTGQSNAKDLPSKEIPKRELGQLHEIPLNEDKEKASIDNADLIYKNEEASTPEDVQEPIAVSVSHVVPHEQEHAAVVTKRIQKRVAASVQGRKPEAVVTENIQAPIIESVPENQVRHEFQRQEESLAVMVKERIQEPFLENMSNKPENQVIEPRNLGVANANILFRIFIWEDMWQELYPRRLLTGVGFGQPQRSSSLEILTWASGEWSRDGWIMPHNSFFHMIYRAGIIGLLIVGGLLGAFVYLTRVFLRRRDISGILLISVLVYWCLMAMFSVTLELPYYAILFWSLMGMIFAYANKKGEGI